MGPRSSIFRSGFSGPVFSDPEFFTSVLHFQSCIFRSFIFLVLQFWSCIWDGVRSVTCRRLYSTQSWARRRRAYSSKSNFWHCLWTMAYDTVFGWVWLLTVNYTSRQKEQRVIICCEIPILAPFISIACLLFASPHVETVYNLCIWLPDYL